MSRPRGIAALAALVAGVLTATAVAALPSISPATVPTTGLGITLPVTVPGVTVPGVTVPPVTVPPVTTPVVTTPGITTPGVTTPTITTPATNDPGGAAGSVVDQVTGAVGSVLNHPNPGSAGSTLSDDKVGALLTQVFGANSANGSNGTSQGGNPGVTGSGNPSDKHAPKLKFKILSRLRTAAKTGKLKLRVTSNEASIVAFNGLLRAGKARRVHGRPLHVSHKLWRTKSKVLAFRKKGKLVVAVKVPKKARGTLGNAKTLRLSLQAWTTDLSRNQARRNVKHTLKR